MDKETLQKKIESGDTVWYLWRFANHIEARPFSLLEDEDNKIRITGAESLYHVYKTLDGWHSEYYSIDELFATKEEVEWQLEFGNIERREKLELPSWEQMQENIDWGIDCANRDWYLLKSRGHNIIRIEDKNSNGIFEKPLTYENYLEACRLCKKLFLGEEL